MSRTRIFLSSTCFDLKALREHVRERIEALGHELLASEYPSFPVAPDLSTVESCKKAVRDHADLLVLIVGGRRGSLDTSGTRSVVNAEYLEARAKGIDCFVFVDKQVWDLLPIYQKNSAADFSPVVDHPDVFKFVSELKSDSRWIYTFTKTDDIITTLQAQLSVFLRMLIERGRAGTLVVPRDFTSDPPSIIALIRERPRFWEHLLTAEFLDRAVAAGRKRLGELKKGAVYRPSECLAADEAAGRLQRFFADLSNILTAFVPAGDTIMSAWGPPGVPGDPIEIRRVCNNITSLIEALVDWETALHFIQVPDRFMPLFECLHGSTSESIEEIARLPVEIRRFVEVAKTATEKGTYKIDLTFRSPSSLKKFGEEMENLNRRLRLW